MAETSRPLSVRDRSSYAEQIRDKISHFTLTYAWLIHRLSDEGLLTDKFEMSATLSGTRIGPKADEILRRSLDILNEYEAKIVWVRWCRCVYYSPVAFPAGINSTV